MHVHMIYNQSYQWSEDIEIWQQMRDILFTPAEQQLIIKFNVCKNITANKRNTLAINKACEAACQKIQPDFIL